MKSDRNVSTDLMENRERNCGLNWSLGTKAPIILTMGKTSRRNTTGRIFAVNLKKILMDRGLSARAGAEVAGVAVSTFNQWLAGSAPLDLEAVYRFAKGVNVDFQYLLLGKSEPPPIMSIKDFYEVSDEPDLSGLFLIEAKRLKPKVKK